jgi:CRISPR-associated protein Cas5h
METNLLKPGYKFFKERIPAEMQPGRVVTEYREVIYEIEGKPIHARVKGAFVLENDECIVPL